MKRLRYPLGGDWPFGDFPPAVYLGTDQRLHLDGRSGCRILRRARLRESRPSLLAQYREHRAADSMHLHVWADGTWSIDHTDDYNPDTGIFAALRHAIADHPLGAALLGWRRAR